MWTFCDVPDLGIDPTNNAAERAMRHPVLMRKLQGGTQQTVSALVRPIHLCDTCWLQGRPLLDWLTDVTTAAHHGQPVPSLLPAPAAQGP